MRTSQPKRVPIDFSYLHVPVGATVEISPAIPRGIVFRLDELFVFDDCAHHFEVVALRVGGASLLPMLPIPAVALRPPFGSGVDLKARVAVTSDSIVLLIKNTSNMAHDFRAVGFARYVEEDAK